MLTIFASELAACVGMNKYQSLSEALKKFWARSNKAVYEAALERNSIIEKTVKQELFEKDVINDIQDIIEKDHTLTSSQVETKIKEIFFEKKQDLSKDLAKQVKSYIHTEKGTRDEEESLDTFEKKINTKIVNRNSKFYKKEFQLKNGYTVKIGGKIDGLGVDGSLIEMKNRQYRFFTQIPLYEKIQIHAYMNILDKSECNLVQNFKGQSKYETITFDSTFWNTVLENLSKFTSLYNKIINNESLQDSLLNGKQYQIWDVSDSESESESESELDDDLVEEDE